MNRFVAPAAASVVVGLLLGAAAIFGVTLMVQQDTKPPLPGGDPQSLVSTGSSTATAVNRPATPVARVAGRVDGRRCCPDAGCGWSRRSHWP